MEKRGKRKEVRSGSRESEGLSGEEGGEVRGEVKGREGKRGKE